MGCGESAFGVDEAGTKPAVFNASQLQRASSGIQTLQGWYKASTGLYETTGWWNSGNAITVLVDYARLSRSTQYNSVLANTFTAAQKTNLNFLNNYYDDELPMRRNLAIRQLGESCLEFFVVVLRVPARK
jgi:TRAP-type mannitol/chloroaromatic compound transport system substrate-binding protein